MKPAYAIEFYLKQRNVSYTIISHQPTTSLEEAANAAKIDLSRLVRAVIMHDNSGVIMVVLPANHLVDFSALQAQLGRTLKLASVQEIADLFIDCQSRTIPPLAEHYGLQAANLRFFSCLQARPSGKGLGFIAGNL